MSDAEPAPPGVDPTSMSTARVYDYLLGGSNNYPVDRMAAEQLLKVLPEIRDVIWCNRAFHQRGARWLAEAGISQFIDPGSGLPTQSNTHEVVHAVDPGAHVVYVDNDPMTAALARQLLRGSDRTRFVGVDLKEVDAVFADADLRSVIDPDQPVGLLATAVFHFIDDDADPHGIVARYLEKLAPGSYLALSHGTADTWREGIGERIAAVYRNANQPIYSRTRAEVERFFAGLEFVAPYDGADPALTFAGLWGAEDPETAHDEASATIYGGIGRKP